MQGNYFRAGQRQLLFFCYDKKKKPIRALYSFPHKLGQIASATLHGSSWPEEGFGLVCADAIGSLCVPLVSEACTDLCQHMKNSLVHRIADVETLTQHSSLIHSDRGLLQRLQEGCRELAPSVTWTAAGKVLADGYQQVIRQHRVKVA